MTNKVKHTIWELFFVSEETNTQQEQEQQGQDRQEMNVEEQEEEEEEEQEDNSVSLLYASTCVSLKYLFLRKLYHSQEKYICVVYR